MLGLQGKYDESKAQGALGGTPTAVASENTDYLKKMVRLEPKRTPASEPAPAAATAALPWTAKATAAASPGPAAKTSTAQVARANDAFKPATVENTSTAPGWQTAVTANVQPLDGSKR